MREKTWLSAGSCLMAAQACMPSSDLDAHAGGSAPSEAPSATVPMAAPGLAPEADPVARATGGVPMTDALGGLDVTAPEPLAEPFPADAVDDDVADAGAADAADARPPAPPLAEPPLEVPAQPEPPLLSEAPPLPDDLIGAPVAGQIIFSDEAEWEVDGVFEPTFEIHTPTASYWVVKPLGTIVSMEDRAPDAAQWIAFSSGFRPRRGVPALPSPPVTRLTTVRDDESQTPTHVRLTSQSDDGLWHWVWDFYLTHVTFTVNRAPAPIGFAYQGVPAGALGAEDQLITSEGVAQSAGNSFNADLPGPAEWAYIADTDAGRSVFLLQHGDDALPERYQVRDNDSSFLSLGNGRVEALPVRFSLGLVDSAEHAQVTRRVEFVAGAIR